LKRFRQRAPAILRHTEMDSCARKWDQPGSAPQRQNPV